MPWKSNYFSLQPKITINVHLDQKLKCTSKSAETFEIIFYYVFLKNILKFRSVDFGSVQTPVFLI